MEFGLDAVDTKSLSEAGVEFEVKDLNGDPLKATNGQIVKIQKILGTFPLNPFNIRFA